MRRKKRYALFTTPPRELGNNDQFLFQTESGFVFLLSPESAEKLRRESLFISGSIRKLKAIALSKSAKFKNKC